MFQLRRAVYKNIIWDVDGTLFNTYPAIVAAFKAVLAEKGIIADAEWIMRLAMQSIGHCVVTLAKEYHLSEAAIYQTFLLCYDQIGYMNPDLLTYLRKTYNPKLRHPQIASKISFYSDVFLDSKSITSFALSYGCGL